MLYLDKILTQLASPLGFGLVLGLVGWVFVWRRKRRLGLAAVGLAIVWLVAWSMPVVSDAFRLSLEGRYTPKAAAELPVAAAIVVLGGGINPPAAGFPAANLDRAVDRVWYAARLYHAGKAPWIVVSAGVHPWRGTRLPEAEATRDLLVDFGVPAEAVVLESESLSTRDNALFSRRILEDRGLESALLVTSALHMRRAEAAFRKAGLDVIPAPTDFEVMPEPPHLLRWLPDVGALHSAGRAWHEYAGYVIYRIRGWV